MKIKMLTTASGSDPTYNFSEGEIRDVSPEEARYWHEAKVCTLLEPYPGDAEKPTLKPSEKAVVKTPETAKGNAATAPVKPPVAAPAAPVMQNTSEWGKK
jgi:hypothetical protein